MGILSIEHQPAAQRADFIVYGLTAAALGLFLLVAVPRADMGMALIALVLGWVAWSAIEYSLHRFVLHQLPPFSRWHAEHHRRPAALLGTPTLVSFLLFAALVFLPVLLLSSVAAACAFTLGTVLGYLGYATTHHAVHHWHGPSLWLSKRKRWHALHHSRPKDAVCFGVTSPGWDRLLGTAPHGRPAHPHPATRP